MQWYYVVLLILMVLLLLTALGIGVISVSPLDTAVILFERIMGINLPASIAQSILGDVILYLRLPRFVASLLAGAGLAVSGVVMQAVMRNPLADPYILGIASGAGLGATGAIALSMSQFMGQDSIGIFAFGGAVLASLIILFLGSRTQSPDSVHILLVGLGVNMICSAGMSLFVALGSDEEGMQTITYWLMGSLLFVQWSDISLMAVVVLILGLFFVSQHRILDLMLFDDDLVLTMGVHVSRYRILYILLSAVLVGVLVCYTGMIGFIGLVVPHMVRLFCGSAHRIVVPLSALTGALFLCWADVACRQMVPGRDIPIGIMAALLGGPIFIVILAHRYYGLNR